MSEPSGPSSHDPRETGAGIEDAAIDAASFVLSLRARGIRDTRILRAMELVPREIFAPRRFADLARTDIALPLPCGQTMTAPRVVATMLMALGLEEGQRVLEIGTGSGYVTALLAHLGGHVQSVERFATLAQSAAEHLSIVGAGGARIEIGDGLAQRPRDRFDRILLNGASPDIPATVTSLLAPGGRLVGAVTIGGVPRLVRIRRPSEGELHPETAAPLRLSPLTAGVAQTL